MADIKVSITPASVREARQKISIFRIGLRKDINQIIDTIGLLIESTAKELVRVDTGRLRASIHYDRPGGVVSTNVSYAPFIEFRFPFLFPAAERWRQAYIDKCREAILSRG